MPVHLRFKMLKQKDELNGMDDESTDIFKTNIIDYYYGRPKNLEYMCLYHFATVASK